MWAWFFVYVETLWLKPQVETHNMECDLYLVEPRQNLYKSFFLYRFDSIYI